MSNETETVYVRPRSSFFQAFCLLFLRVGLGFLLIFWGLARVTNPDINQMLADNFYNTAVGVEQSAEDAAGDATQGAGDVAQDAAQATGDAAEAAGDAAQDAGDAVGNAANDAANTIDGTDETAAENTVEGAQQALGQVGAYLEQAMDTFTDPQFVPVLGWIQVAFGTLIALGILRIITFPIQIVINGFVAYAVWWGIVDPFKLYVDPYPTGFPFPQLFYPSIIIFAASLLLLAYIRQDRFAVTGSK